MKRRGRSKATMNSARTVAGRALRMTTRASPSSTGFVDAVCDEQHRLAGAGEEALEFFLEQQPVGSSSALNGSSISSTSASATTARAIATRCRIPSESCADRRAKPASPTPPARRGPPPAAVCGRRRRPQRIGDVVHDPDHGDRETPWNTVAVGSRRSRSNTSATPAVCRSSPADGGRC